MKNESHKWIVGTGFSRGIGAEIAHKIHARGLKILHIGRTKGQYDDEFLYLDLSKPFTKEFLADLKSALKSKNLRGFLYGAGLMPELACAKSEAEVVEYWASQKKSMQINYFSCASLANEVLPFLYNSRESGNDPFLAHLSSLAAVDPLPNLEVYGITKLASLKYFEYLAKNIASTDIPCLSIHPGTVQTDMLNQLLVTKSGEPLPVTNLLDEAVKSNSVITAEQAAENIDHFLFDAAADAKRFDAHGKLYIADNDTIFSYKL